MPIVGSDAELLSTFAAYWREAATPAQHDLWVQHQFAPLAQIAIEWAQGIRAVEKRRQELRPARVAPPTHNSQRYSAGSQRQLPAGRRSQPHCASGVAWGSQRPPELLIRRPHRWRRSCRSDQTVSIIATDRGPLPRRRRRDFAIGDRYLDLGQELRWGHLYLAALVHWKPSRTHHTSGADTRLRAHARRAAGRDAVLIVIQHAGGRLRGQHRLAPMLLGGCIRRSRLGVPHR